MSGKTLQEIQKESSAARDSIMSDFAKWWTIFQTVWTIVNNFTSAGGPTVNPLIVANETSKELVRKVASGHLPEDVLIGHQDIIQAAIDAHPAIQNIHL